MSEVNIDICSYCISISTYGGPKSGKTDYACVRCKMTYCNEHKKVSATGRNYCPLCYHNICKSSQVRTIAYS